MSDTLEQMVEEAVEKSRAAHESEREAEKPTLALACGVRPAAIKYVLRKPSRSSTPSCCQSTARGIRLTR